MTQVILGRFRHLAALWREGLIARWIGLVYSLIGIYVFVRDEIWRPTDVSRWSVIAVVPHLSLSWWLFGGAILLAVWLFESSFRVTKRIRESFGLSDGGLPLTITFDHANPNQRFWSLEPNRDEGGKRVTGSHWEYRAAIKNETHRTIRNVKVIVEAIGPLPARPVQSPFDIDRKTLRDLSPQEEALAVMRTWYFPAIIVGLAVGEDVYGPIKLTVFADDVPPTTKLFHFDPMRMPAVYEGEPPHRDWTRWAETLSSPTR